MAHRTIRPGGPRRGLVWVIAGLTCLVTITACGSSDYTYVSNKGEQTYFKVPAGWNRLDDTALRMMFANADPQSVEQMFIDGTRWVVAFDSSATPDLEHVSLSSAEPIVEPVILAVIQDVSSEESGTFSLDHLRNFLVPTTEDAEKQLNEALTAQGLQYRVDVHHDEAVAPTADLHGVRRLYTFKLGPLPLETHDLTVLVNNDESKLYMFLVRCATVCFQTRETELLEIADSFTVVGRD